MRYDHFYDRADPGAAYHFEDEPTTVKVKARTLGCGCCSREVEVSRANLESELESLEKRAADVRRFLAEYF